MMTEQQQQLEQQPAAAATGGSPSNPDEDAVVALKLLVPPQRGGQLDWEGRRTINDLQSNLGRASSSLRPEDFFPNTRGAFYVHHPNILIVSRALASTLLSISPPSSKDRIVLILEKEKSRRFGLLAPACPTGSNQPERAMERSSLATRLVEQHAAAVLGDPACSRFVVPSRSASVLIGQGGSSIKKLAQLRRRIQLHNRNGPVLDDTGHPEGAHRGSALPPLAACSKRSSNV